MNYIGTYKCEDKGVKHIDLYFEEHEEAKEFGEKEWFIRIKNNCTFIFHML